MTGRPLAGCWRPFEPIQLQTISPNEEAFLLPLTDDVKKQTSTNNEEVRTAMFEIPESVKPVRDKVLEMLESGELREGQP